MQRKPRVFACGFLSSDQSIYSKPSYERQLREWGIRKNVVGWRALATAHELRKIDGKETDVIVANKRLSKHRVKKMIRRHISTTTAMNLKYGTGECFVT